MSNIETLLLILMYTAIWTLLGWTCIGIVAFVIWLFVFKIFNNNAPKFQDLDRKFSGALQSEKFKSRNKMRSEESVKNAIRFLEQEISNRKYDIDYHYGSRMHREIAKDQIEIMEAQRTTLNWVLSDKPIDLSRTIISDFRHWVK